MAGITYIANARAPLIVDTSPVHVAGEEYSLDIKLQQFVEGIDIPKSVHVSLNGGVETVLRRSSMVQSAVFIWPDTLNEDMMEFLFSIAGGEAFTFDPYGTIAVPDVAVSMVCLNTDFSIGRISHGSTPWRSVSLSLRPLA